MSAYRTAYLFCRALAFYLWCNTAISFIALVLTLVGGLVLRFGGLGGLNFSPLGWLAAAALVSAFAKGISAALVGQSVLEGEAVQASNALHAQERVLVQAMGGLLLLIEALVSIPSFLSSLFAYWRMSFPMAGPGSIGFSLFSLLTFPFLTLVAKGLIGFFFAFRANLQKLSAR